jgi:hypothetical protein
MKSVMTISRSDLEWLKKQPEYYRLVEAVETNYSVLLLEMIESTECNFSAKHWVLIKMNS